MSPSTRGLRDHLPTDLLHIMPKSKRKYTNSDASFQRLVADELTSARKKHPGKQNSFHEGYGVLLEEVDEFWDEVKKRSSKRIPAKVLAELVQVAAMAQRTAEDLGLV